MAMKHFIYIAFIALLGFSSCSTSKQARTYKKTIDGDWLLKSVVTQGIKGKVKSVIFNEADFNCFVGSTWSFNDRNSLGSYTLASTNGDGCTSLNRDFRWSIYEATASDPKLFQFKRLDANLKEMDDGAGFRFDILEATDQSLELRSNFEFEGKPAAFIYHFVKL